MPTRAEASTVVVAKVVAGATVEVDTTVVTDAIVVVVATTVVAGAAVVADATVVAGSAVVAGATVDADATVVAGAAVVAGSVVVAGAAVVAGAGGSTETHPAGPIATFDGNGLVAMVSTTVKLVRSTFDNVFEKVLATNKNRPSGLTAKPFGPLPTEIVATSARERAS